MAVDAGRDMAPLAAASSEAGDASEPPAGAGARSGAPAGAGSGAPADTSGDACAEVAPVLRSSVAVGAATDSEQTDRAQVNPCQTAATQLKNSIGGLANHM